MEVIRKIWSYLNFFKKQDAPNDEKMSFNLRAMHTINKISLLMFLFALVFMILKWTVL